MLLYLKLTCCLLVWIKPVAHICIVYSPIREYSDVSFTSSHLDYYILVIVWNFPPIFTSIYQLRVFWQPILFAVALAMALSRANYKAVAIAVGAVKALKAYSVAITAALAERTTACLTKNAWGFKKHRIAAR